MKRSLGLALLVLCFPWSMRAQSEPPGQTGQSSSLAGPKTGSDAGLGHQDPHFATEQSFVHPAGQSSLISYARHVRWLCDTETGSDAGLGYKEPHFAMGPSFELPIGSRFEIQGGAHYSPDKKFLTNDGNTLVVQALGVLWISHRFGLTGGMRHSNLWTSQFNKSSYLPSAGIVIRDQVAGPGRFYADFLFPTGCEWGPECPLQSNRLKGPEFYWEHRIWSHIRIGFHLGVYHILNQSNNLRPDITRTGEWTGNAHMEIRLEFPGGSLGKYY